MLKVEQIEDFDTLQLHARHLALELEFFQKRNAEMAKEIARLKELSPEQLQREIARQAEQLAKLRRKVFGESTERRPSPDPPEAEAGKKSKRGHGPTAQTKLPTREVHHRLGDNERECPACKGTLEEMGEHTEDTEEITCSSPADRRRRSVACSATSRAS